MKPRACPISSLPSDVIIPISGGIVVSLSASVSIVVISTSSVFMSLLYGQKRFDSSRKIDLILPYTSVYSTAYSVLSKCL